MSKKYVVACARNHGIEIHAEGCNHLGATAIDERGVRSPKYLSVRVDEGETIDEVRYNVTRNNDGLWVDKVAGCALNGRGKSYPMPDAFECGMGCPCYPCVPEVKDAWVWSLVKGELK